MPEATKLNIQAPGILDYFFEACDNEDRIILADMGAGSGIATFDWFEKMFEESQEMNIRFTSVGVTTNEPGAILSILKWANRLRHRVDYLIVLNATLASGDTFEYWHEDPTVKKFIELSNPHVMQADARITEFQTELRNRPTRSVLPPQCTRSGGRRFCAPTTCVSRSLSTFGLLSVNPG